MKKYLKEVYFERTEDAIDVLVDLLYNTDIIKAATQLRKDFEEAKARDEAEVKADKEVRCPNCKFIPMTKKCYGWQCPRCKFTAG